MKTLSATQAASYWQERHRTSDPWRAGGARGMSERDNEIFYWIRHGLILRLLWHHFGTHRPLTVIDAGCGRGWLTGRLRELGHDVSGYDVSSDAVDRATDEHGPWFTATPLDRIPRRERADAVISMDVLYHLTDDDQWRASMERLTELVAPGGAFLFSAWMDHERQQLGDYIVHRSRAEHEALLRELGFRLVMEEQYSVFDNPISMHLAVPVAEAPTVDPD